MHYNYVEWGKSVRKHRESKNFTREQLAEECDLSDKCISNLELGSSDPKLSTILKIYKALDCDVAELAAFF